jgi:hypothetical protein
LYLMLAITAWTHTARTSVSGEIVLQVYAANKQPVIADIRNTFLSISTTISSPCAANP